MSDERKPGAEDATPTADRSWERTVEILDLVNQIRDARRRRQEEQQPPPAPRPTRG